MALFLRSTLLAALVAACMLTQATAQLERRTVRHPGFQALEARATIHQCFKDLSIDNAAYEAACGANSPPNHPCITLWDETVQDVEVCAYDKDVPVKTQVVVKDNHWKDFSTKDPSTPFRLRWPHAKNARLYHYNYDPATGCYDVEVAIDSISCGWRLSISSEDGQGWDLDTKNSYRSKTRLCKKWLRVKLADTEYRGRGC